MFCLFFKRLPKLLSFIAVISFAILLVLKSYPPSIEEYSKYENIIFSILTSVVAAYIFYIIDIYIKNIKFIHYNTPIITHIDNSIYNIACKILEDISKISGVNIDIENMTLEKLHDALSKIDPNKKYTFVTNISGIQNIFIYLHNENMRIEKRVLELFFFYKELNNEYSKILYSIKLSNYVSAISLSTIKKYSPSDKNITFISKSMYNFFNEILKLHLTPKF